MRALRKSEIRSAAINGKLPEMENLQELLIAFRSHGLHIPFERMEPIMKEHQLLKEHRSLVNELAQQNGPSHISMSIARQNKNARQP